ncbi:phosphotransferase family protein [Hydrogenophaga sp.]|uniref:phosphotransferase family protein n=1 Tax=Hydrogenophaga sp. TaxID=1904254 RepID=UPI003F716EAC
MSQAAPASSADMATRLRAVARRCIEGAEDVTGVCEITSGASQSLWAFDAITPQGAVPLIVRSARLWSEQAQAGSAGMAAEAALLRLAAAGGVPVPALHGELRPEDGLGEGYVMERLEGETRGPRILRDAAFNAVRPKLAEQCGAIMARIHALPRAELPPLRTAFARDEALNWAQRLGTGGGKRPVLAWALRWLLAHAPEPQTHATLVHADFRNGNLMIDSEGVRGVLDWELAHLGDPMEDLGYFCMNAWRYGQIDQHAGGLGSREALFAGYSSVTGVPVDAARVHWWEVFGAFKWCISCDSMGQAFSSGLDPALERAAVGRRASESELELLHLLAPRP